MVRIFRTLLITFLLVGWGITPIHAQDWNGKTEVVSSSAKGDQTIPLGRYKIGAGIRIEARIGGGWSADGGIYHIAGDWNSVPQVVYRGESSISNRLKFYGYVDPDSKGHMYLFATWDNQSPDESWTNAVYLKITSSTSFNTSNTGSFAKAKSLNEVLTVNHTGNVGVGTTSPGKKLEVNGTTRTKEVIVETKNWPDYVFDESYDLRTPAELAAFIEREGHLPALPSAETVEAEGQTVGEVQRGLVQTVEELARYAIEQERRADRRAASLGKLQGQLDSLSAANDHLRRQNVTQRRILKQQQARIDSLENQMNRLLEQLSTK